MNDTKWSKGLKCYMCVCGVGGEQLTKRFWMWEPGMGGVGEEGAKIIYLDWWLFSCLLQTSICPSRYSPKRQNFFTLTEVREKAQTCRLGLVDHCGSLSAGEGME